MRRRSASFYVQLAGLYLALLVAFSAIAAILIIGQLDGFFGEVEQRLNRQLASRLLQEISPALADAGIEGARKAAKHVSGINPGIDIYLLNTAGRVTASFTGKPSARSQVDVARIQEYLGGDIKFPLRAEDPGAATGNKVFSAAALPASLGGGYLYVVLPGMPFDNAAHMVRTSYIIRGAIGLLLMVLLTTVAAGLGCLYLLTQRFQRLTHAVRRFQEGALTERAVVEADDQIGHLASTFNEMAATIEHQFRVLKEADDARRSLADNISHDFRTPLTALRGFADRLVRAGDRLAPEERRQHLSAILKSTAQLEHLSNQLTTVARLDRDGDHALSVETFSIAELAQDAVLKFAPLAEQCGVTLSLVDPERVPQVAGDIALIERAIANLLDNALKNTPPGGRVSLSLPCAGERVTVRIADTGRGIAAEDLPMVTKRFYRTAASKLAGVEGTGLGLAIVEDILAKHAAKLRIESQPHIGTVVSFELIAA